MKKFLASSGLSLLFLSLLVVPAQAGSEGVEGPDSSSSIGDTFDPSTLGAIEQVISPIRGASATTSDDGSTITVSVPSQQITAVFTRANGAVQLQITKYSADDVESLQLLASGASLNEVLQQAIATLQRVDPARAARIQALLTKLNALITTLSNQRSDLAPETRLLVAANLDAIQGELRGTAVSEQEFLLAQAADQSAPTVVYDPAVAGAVVDAVQQHNQTVQSLSNQDATSLAADTNFVVIADLLEQIAGELRGQPVPDEELASIDDIIASLSK